MLLNKFKNLCPLCGNGKYLHVRHANGAFGKKEIGCCKTCGLSRIIEMPTEFEIDKLNKKYWSRNYDFTARIINKSQEISRLKYIRRKLKDGSFEKILDYGSGIGLFQEVLIESDYKPFQYHAVDKDVSCSIKIKKRGGVSFSNDIEFFQKDNFDLILCSHVLEHQTDPVALLQKLLNKLKKNGNLFIEIPNQDHLYKENVGAHLIFFSPETLVKMLENLSNASIVDILTVGNEIENFNLTFKGKLNEILETSKAIIKGFLPKSLKNIIENVVYYYKKKNDSFSEIQHKLKLNEIKRNGQWIRCIIKKY